MATLRRKETWLARRGEILEAAGRHQEALSAYADALAALEQLPAQHRNLPPMRDLEARLRQLLGSLRDARKCFPTTASTSDTPFQKVTHETESLPPASANAGHRAASFPRRKL